MNWRVVVRPEVETDVTTVAAWYENQQPGLGRDFRQAVLQVFDALALNPLLNSRRHPHRDIRWRYPDRFPYRVIYQVIPAQNLIIIAAVLHAARSDRHWQKLI